MLTLLLGIVVSGLIVGGLARLAVPGPDPMPVWRTIALGVAGSFLGAVVGAALGLSPNEGDSTSVLPSFLVSVVGATLLLLLYRRYVQRRPITGPAAKRRPRGRGRRPAPWPQRDAERSDGDPVEQLARLVALRDSGQIDLQEFERRKAALVARI